MQTPLYVIFSHKVMKNDTRRSHHSCKKITDIMSKKSPTLCQPTLIQGAKKNLQRNIVNKSKYY
jgi:hypothetical protein